MRIKWSLPAATGVPDHVSKVLTAQDMTQAFFEGVLEKQLISRADPGRGRFRAFLLTACKRFLIREWHKSQAAKRGGGQRHLSLDLATGESRYRSDAADHETPERSFERQWAITLLARVLDSLRREYAERDKLTQFDVLKRFLSSGDHAGRQAEAAAELEMTPGAFKVAVHRARGRYRKPLRFQVYQRFRATVKPSILKVSAYFRRRLSAKTRGARAPASRAAWARDL